MTIASTDTDNAALASDDEMKYAGYNYFPFDFLMLPSIFVVSQFS